MNSGGEILISSSGIASFFLSSVTYNWNLSPATSISTMGIAFGNPDTSFVAYFAKDSSKCYLSLIHLSDGLIFY